MSTTPPALEEKDARLISDAVAARIGLVSLMVVAWYVTRKQSQATLLQNTKRLRGNAYGMWLLMLMTSVKLFLFAVLIAICATTMWEVILLIYVDKEDQQKQQRDRLEYRSFLAFLTDVAFYKCALAAIGTCLLLATAMILFYSTAKGRASKDDYAKEELPYPEFYVLLYLDISSGLVLAWAIFYLINQRTKFVS